MTPIDLARSYYRNVNAKDIEGVLDLFTPNATFHLPDGREVTGRESLRGMYENVFAQGGPQPQPVRIVADEHGAAAELEVALADGRVLHMASFFTLHENGLAERVAVYRRG